MIFSESVFNVKDYGAAGDGKTDDTQAIKKAISAALSRGKATVYLPAGEYRITETIAVEGDPSKMLAIKGDDNALASAAITGNMNGTLFDIKMKYNFSVANVTFIHKGSSGSAIATGTVNCKIIDCDFTNTGNNKNPMVKFYGSNVKIADCRFNNTCEDAYAIQCTAVDGILSINSYIIDSYIAHIGKGVLVDSETDTNRPEGLKIGRNVFLNTGKEQITVKTILHLDVSNNMLDQCSLYSILIAPERLGVTGLYITDNYISAAAGYGAPSRKKGTTCIQTAGTGAGLIFTVSGNMMCYCDYGIVITGNTNGWNIANNTFNSIDACGIFMRGSGSNIIESNSFLLYTKGKSVDISSVRGPNTIVNNQFTDNYTIDLSGGEHIIENNISSKHLSKYEAPKAE